MQPEQRSCGAVYFVRHRDLRRRLGALGGGGPDVRQPIGQALADAAQHGPHCPLLIFAAQRRTVGVAEIELRQIPLQMLLRAVLVDALHAALEDREEAFNRVRRGDLAILVAGIFAAAMVNRAMGGELSADAAIVLGLIGVEDRGAVGMGHDGGDVLFAKRLDMNRAGATAALNERHDLAHIARAALALPALAADEDGRLFAEEGFVDLKGDALAAHGGHDGVAHGLTDAVAQEPRGLVLDLQSALQLLRADALLGRTHQVDGLKPLVQGQVAFLEDGADADRELLAAGGALLEAVADHAFRVLLGGLRADALQVIDLADDAAVRARRLAIPDDAFDEFEGGGFIMKVGLGQNGHGGISLPLHPTAPLGFVNYTYPF